MVKGWDWQRRRRERAITRLTARINQTRDDIDVLNAQAGQLSADADHASVDAVVRPAGPNQREANRAAATRDNHQRLLAEHRETLDRLRRQRDALLDQM